MGLKCIVDQRDRVEMTNLLYKQRPNKKKCRVNILESFVVIQESSKALFKTLQCNRHTTHITHIGLFPKMEDLKVAQIWFDLHFPSKDADSRGTSSDLGLLLRIESCLRSKDALAQQPQLEQHSECSPTPTRFIPSELVLLSQSIASNDRRKRVKFENEIPSAEDFAISNQKPNLAPDFCQWLSNSIRAASSRQDGCIGRLDRNARHQLRFHIKHDAMSDRSLVSISLHKLLEMMQAGDLKGRLPFHEKLRFAKILATAVLIFHNTPWFLSGAWHKANIVFCNIDVDANLDTNPLPDPYLSVPIMTAPKRVLETTSGNIHITNLPVFRLGIMLLELAFEQPLESMQTPADQVRAKDALDVQYATARRLLLSVKDKTTCREYENVIKLCIVQYGRGEPLEQCDRETLAQYHSDIIQELQQVDDRICKIYEGI